MTNGLLYLQQRTFNHTRLVIVLVTCNNTREIVLKTTPRQEEPTVVGRCSSVLAVWDY